MNLSQWKSSGHKYLVKTVIFIPILIIIILILIIMIILLYLLKNIIITALLVP